MRLYNKVALYLFLLSVFFSLFHFNLFLCVHELSSLDALCYGSCCTVLTSSLKYDTVLVWWQSVGSAFADVHRAINVAAYVEEPYLDVSPQFVCIFAESVLRDSLVSGFSNSVTWPLFVAPLLRKLCPLFLSLSSHEPPPRFWPEQRGYSPISRLSSSRIPRFPNFRRDEIFGVRAEIVPTLSMHFPCNYTPINDVNFLIRRNEFKFLGNVIQNGTKYIIKRVNLVIEL